MNFRRLIVAVVLLLLLGGALYWSQNHKPSTDSTVSDTAAAPSILKVAPSSVAQLALRKKGSAVVTLTKGAGGQWQITQPAAYAADQESVAGILSTLSGLNADRIVEEKASDIKQYGLSDPANELDITGQDGKTQQLMFGDNTPAGSGVYAMLAGRVFTVATATRTSLDKGLNDLRDKRLVTIDADKLRRVEVVKSPRPIEFARAKDQWEIAKPEGLRADSLAVDDLVRSLSTARMDLSTPAISAADFRKAKPVGTAVLAGDKGEETLEVKKYKDNDYAKSSVLDGIYRVDATLGQALTKNLDDFRNKKLFDFGFQDPLKIEFHAGTKSWLLTRSGADWWWNGKKVEPAAAQTFLAKLRDLSASKFATSGFSQPEIEVTVTPENKQSEKVSLAKSGDGYLAKRGDESTLYQLDRAAVTDLVSAADGIKSAK